MLKHIWCIIFLVLVFFFRLEEKTSMNRKRNSTTQRVASFGHCANCLAVNRSGNFSRCSGCDLVVYCRKDCQQAHWKFHKTDVGCIGLPKTPPVSPEKSLLSTVTHPQCDARGTGCETVNIQIPRKETNLQTCLHTVRLHPVPNRVHIYVLRLLLLSRRHRDLCPTGLEFAFSDTIVSLVRSLNN